MNMKTVVITSTIIIIVKIYSITSTVKKAEADEQQ